MKILDLHSHTEHLTKWFEANYLSNSTKFPIRNVSGCDMDSASEKHIDFYLFIYLFKQLVSRHNVNRTNKIYTEESQARISHAISKQSVYEIKMFSNYV